MNKPNKFWDFINNSHVRLKIKPDQVLQWHRRGWNGEGYSWEGESWKIEDGVLINEYCSGLETVMEATEAAALWFVL